MGVFLMSGASSPSGGGTVGFLLSLLTESFAVRALVGSLLAAALAAVAVRLGLVTSRRARRLLVLGPVLTAAAAGAASVHDAFLPQLWLASFGDGAGAQLLDLPGHLGVVSLHRDVDLLAVAYAGVAGVLLSRRVLGEIVVRRTLRRAARQPVAAGLRTSVAAVARRMGDCDRRAAGRLARIRVRCLAHCPGGAFTVGFLRPVLVVDPELVTTLDDRELEGLLAHELAHIARGDCALGLLVGVFRDLTFFLPSVQLARRWLAREQEEGADELAVLCTGRPAALASGILKVWDRNRGSHIAVPGAACAAVSSPRLRPLGAGWSPSAGPGWGPSAGPKRAAASATRAVTERVERLITARPELSPARLVAELGLAVTVLGAATVASILVPSWIASGPDRDALAFGYLAAVPEAPVESPAFMTFRALAPSTATGDQPGSAKSAGRRSGAFRAGDEPAAGPCPCVETQGQRHRGVAAAGPDTEARMLWRREAQGAWMVSSVETPGVSAARPLWTATEGGARFGFFLVGSPA